MSKEIYDLSYALTSTLKVPSPKGLHYLPHQLAAIHYLDAVPGNVLVGDPPGTGKTIVTAGYINLKRLQRVTIVCPASLTDNWARELNKWLIQKLDIQVYRSSRDKLWSKNIIIQSYDIARNGKVRKYLDKTPQDLLSLDEGHYLKNPKAKRTVACLSNSGLLPLFKKSICLTGTPVSNRPIELYPIIRSMNWKAVGYKSYLEYAFKYCAAHYGDWGLDVSGYSNLEELGKLLRSNFMIRRKKRDVLDLPPLFPPNLVFLDPTLKAKKAVKTQKKFVAKDVLKMSGTTVGFEGLSASRRILGVEKIPQAIKYIEDQIRIRGKVVAFAHHQEVIDRIEERFAGQVVVIRGGTPSKKRQGLVDSFQNDPRINLFLGSIDATGIGITLTASDYICFIENSWVPGNNQQAIDRVDRHGQTRSVVVDFLIYEGSMDENILKASTFKGEKIKSIMDQPQEKGEKKMEKKIVKFMLALSALILAHFGTEAETATNPPATGKGKGKGKGRGKGKAKAEAEAEEVEEDAPEEDFGDFDLGEGEEDEEGEGPTLEDCEKALKAYAKEKGRKKAIAVLVKFKVKKVGELDESEYENFCEALS